MKQLWPAQKILSLMVLALAPLAAAPTLAQTQPDAATSSPSAPINPQQSDKPAILLPNSTTNTQYDLNFGFPDHNGAFSAMLVVIPKAEMDEFNKPGGVRHLDRVAKAEAGAVLAVKIMVTGQQPDPNGIAKVTSDLQVLAPSGAIYGHSDYKELPVWVGPAGKGVYDNRDRVVLLRFESNDAPGVYTIKAMVHDRFGQRDIPLQTTVELLPPRTALPSAAQTAPAITAPDPATVAPAEGAQPPTADDNAKPAATVKKKRRRHH